MDEQTIAPETPIVEVPVAPEEVVSVPTAEVSE